jgi:anti-sigma regulatory factor (Ser/Thr protein kinase)
VDHATHGAPSPTDVDGWAASAFAQLEGIAGVGRVGLALLEGGGRRLRFTASERRSEGDPGWCHIDGYDDVPLNVAVRQAAPVIGSLDDLKERYADFAAAQRGTAHVAVAAVPISTAGEVLGGFVLYFDRPQRFDRHQRAELARAGHRLGTSLRRAWPGGARRPGSGPQAATPPGAEVAVHDVPARLAAVADARRFLDETLHRWKVDPEQIETARLCLSELVTNAVVHSHGGCEVRAMLHEGVLTVSVRDSGIVGAVPLEPSGDPLAVHGRGLQLVEALAHRWGRDPGHDGGSVWFALEVG